MRITPVIPVSVTQDHTIDHPEGCNGRADLLRHSLYPSIEHGYATIADDEVHVHDARQLTPKKPDPICDCLELGHQQTLARDGFHRSSAGAPEQTCVCLRQTIMTRSILIVGMMLAACGAPATPPSSRQAHACPTPGTGPGTAVIEWVDFVKLNGITYISDLATQGQTVDANAVGPIHRRTTCKLADNMTDPGYRTQDGDAAFLPPGTELHVINGYDPAFRLTARRDGHWLIYEADTVPGADEGRDLLDIDDRVVYIGVNSVKDGTTELASIRNVERVGELVQMALTAPVDQDREPTDQDYEKQRFVAFHLDDGTSTVRALFPETRLLSRGIIVPQEFVDAIEAAVTG